MTTATGLLSADRNAVLATLGDYIREIGNPDDLAYAAAELLGRSLNVSRAGYGTVDTSAETITIAATGTLPGSRAWPACCAFATMAAISKT